MRVGRALPAKLVPILSCPSIRVEPRGVGVFRPSSLGYQRLDLHLCFLQHNATMTHVPAVVHYTKAVTWPPIAPSH